MASIVIRQLDDKIKEKLRLRASRHGLRAALTARPQNQPNLFEAIRRHIDPLGGIDLDIPKREPLPKPIDFS